MSRFDAMVTRIQALHPKLIDLSLGRLEVLLDKLGHPERQLPPVVHVAGTNGKGSTCAFLRATGEAAGWRVHVYTSPHLVRFNERFRIAGALVSDAVLEQTLDEVEAVNAGAPITVFEVITAVAFLLFSRHPAELCVIEVGLGGRYDATNVVPPPAACAIASISLDHRNFLGDEIGQIAWEKAGIVKPGTPVATGLQPPEAAAAIARQAEAVGARLLARGRDWHIRPDSGGLRYEDPLGALDLPLPGLAGRHQIDNAGIALAALRAAGLGLPDRACAGIARAEWPARLQRLHGALAATLPPGSELWLDGGHNPGAGVALAEVLAEWRDRPLDLVVGMKQAKDTAEFLRPLLPLAGRIWAVAEPGQHLAVPVADIVAASGGIARPGPGVADALRAISQAGQERGPGGTSPGRVLICGSLYLAGEVLKLDNGTARVVAYPA